MEKVAVVFSTDLKVMVTILTEREPEISEHFLKALSDKPQVLVCNHPVSAGKMFDAYLRFPYEPVQKLQGARPVAYAELENGDVLWDGEKLSIVYGEVMQPGVAGYVIGKADTSDDFQRGCLKIWNDFYREHTVSTITITKE